MLDSQFQDEEYDQCISSQALLRSDSPPEEKLERRNNQTISCYFLILLLSAHTLGWMLALLILPSPNRNVQLSGDDINGIIPQSK